MYRKTNNGKLILLIGVVIVIFAAIIIIFGHGIIPLNSFAVPVTQGGITLQSLSHVFVQGINQNSYSGWYFLAQALVNSGQATIFLSGSSTSIAQELNSTFTGNGQSESVTLQALKNQLIYPAGGQFGQYVLVTYSYAGNPNGVTFTDCNGHQQTYAGTTAAPGTTGCIVGSSSATTSYTSGCKNSVASTNSTYVAVVTQGNGGLLCSEIVYNTWAHVYQLGSAVYNQAVLLNFNGRQLQVNESSTYQTLLNSSGDVQLALQLLPTANGQTGAVPSSQSIGALFINKSTSKLLSYSDIPNIQSAIAGTQTAIANNESNGVISCLNGLGPLICYGNGGIQGGLATINSHVTGLYQMPTSSYYGSAIINSTSSNLQVIINDPTFQFITPDITLASSLPFMGIQIAQADCGIVSVTSPTFTSGSTGTVGVQLKNTAPVAGSCLTSLSLPSPFYSITSQQKTYIPAGGTNTTLFTIASSQADQNGGSIHVTGTATTCNYVTGQNCVTASFGVTENPTCTNGGFLNGNCTSVTSISVPTTQTTTVCGAGCVTTTIPSCPPVNGTQTYWNTTQNKCLPTPGNSNWEQFIPDIILAIVVAVAILAYFSYKGKQRGRYGRKATKRYNRSTANGFKFDNKTLLMIIGVVVFIYLIYANLLIWGIVIGAILGGLYLLSTMFHPSVTWVKK